LYKDVIQSKSFRWGVSLFTALLILPAFLHDYYVTLFNEAFIAAILAMSLNLVLGYGGMLQLHFAVFSGVGGYALGLMIAKANLPVAVAFLLAPLIAMLTGLIVHWLLIRLRGIYFAALSVALGELIWAVVFKWRDFTGGEDGLLGVSSPPFTHSVHGGYYFALIVGTGCILLMYMIIKSPFGRMVEAIRDNEQRARAIGISVTRQCLVVCTIASGFAGIAGMLLVAYHKAGSIGMFDFHRSVEVLTMPILGGMHVFMGPVLGAFVMTMLMRFLPAYTVYNLAVLGGILLVLVVFLPNGLLGYPQAYSKMRSYIKGVFGVFAGRRNKQSI
jgi:branched-chain amino acid transport system permease protein